MMFFQKYYSVLQICKVILIHLQLINATLYKWEVNFCNYLLTYLITYLLTYLPHGAESILRS